MKVGDKVRVKRSGYVGVITSIRNIVYFLDYINTFGLLEEDLELIVSEKFNEDLMEYLLS